MNIPDIPSIAAAITAMKELFGLAKTMREDSTADEKSKAALSELLNRLITTQSLMLDAQAKVYEVMEYNRQVTRDIESYRNWDEDADRYQLCEPCHGTIVYAQKPDVNSVQPPHYLCPNCFAKKTKSFLQGMGSSRECYPCGKFFQIKSNTSPARAD